MANLFIVETNKTPAYVKKIFKQRFDRFECLDPCMQSHSDSAVRIRDNSGADPFIIEIQIKLNNSIAEYYRGSHENKTPFTMNDYDGAPEKYFLVDNQHGQFVQKYGSLTSWNVKIITPPASWESLYSQTAP